MVEARGSVWDLVRTIRSLERQTEPALEVRVSARNESGRRCAAMLAAAGRIRADAAASRNAALAASEAPLVLWLDEGDVLDPVYLQLALARLAADDGLGWVAAWITRPTAADVPGPACSPDPAGPSIADPSRVPVGAVLRRSLWTGLGGFDDTLDDLHDWDFWLGAALGEVRGAILERPLVTRPRVELPPEERSEHLARRAKAFRAIVTKRRALFARDPAALLLGQEREIERLAATHEHRVARRDAIVAETAALEAERARLLRELEPADSEGFDWGDLARTTPVSTDWGYERGTPVDRHYIEGFVERWAADIHGVVLEVQEPDLAHRFGGDRVTRADVVDIDPGNPRATVVADLRHATAIADGVYDCVILTQTLHVIDDMRAVLRECYRILKPGGVLLATLPSASRVAIEYGPDGDFWRVTAAGARELFAAVFPRDALVVEPRGNVLVNVAFLHGLALEEVAADALTSDDPHFPLLVGVRAVKPGGGVALRTPRGGGGNQGVILLFHRVAAPVSDVHGLAVDPSEFEEHVAVLRREFEPLPLADLVDAAASDRLPRRAVAITFDDGYHDNLSVASPILLGYQVPATFFVTTLGLEPGAEYWWDTLEGVLLCGLPVPPRLELELGGSTRRFATATAAERRVAHQAIAEAMVRADGDARERAIDGLLGWARLHRPVRVDARLLDAAGAHELAARPGHSLGTHGERHLAMPALDPTARDREANVRVAIGRLVGADVRAFAYPYGAIDEASIETVRRAGYRLAVSCAPGLVRAQIDPLSLPRIEVKHSSGTELAVMLEKLFAEARA